MKAVLEGHVEAIVPIYDESGANFTMVKRIDGDLVIENSTRTVLKEISKVYHYDLKSSNEEYGELLCVKKMPPILFEPKLTLIAVKTRVSIGKDDGAFSYVNIEEIKYLKDQIIYFKAGSSLKVLSTDKTVKKYISHAKLLKNLKPRKYSFIMETQEIFDIYKKEQKYIRKGVESLSKIKDEVYKRM